MKRILAILVLIGGCFPAIAGPPATSTRPTVVYSTLPWRLYIEGELRRGERGPAPTDPAVLQALRDLQASNARILAILEARIPVPIPGTPALPPAPPVIIYQPGAPLQTIPIAGVPYQVLPVPGVPLQTIPIPGSPLQILPIPGAPHVIIPPGPGQPLQVLPIGPPSAGLPPLATPLPFAPPPSAPPLQPLPVTPPGTIVPLPLSSGRPGVREERTPPSSVAPPTGYQRYTHSLWKPSPQR